MKCYVLSERIKEVCKPMVDELHCFIYKKLSENYQNITNKCGVFEYEMIDFFLYFSVFFWRYSLIFPVNCRSSLILY